MAPGAPHRTTAHDGRVPLFSFEGRAPTVSPEAWIAPTATLVGDVQVEAEAGVPARVVGPVTGRAGQWVADNPRIYRELARRHAAGVLPVPGPVPG